MLPLHLPPKKNFSSEDNAVIILFCASNNTHCNSTTHVQLNHSPHCGSGVSSAFACFSCSRKFAQSQLRSVGTQLEFQPRIFPPTQYLNQEAEMLPSRRFSRQGRVLKLRFIASCSRDANGEHKLHMWALAQNTQLPFLELTHAQTCAKLNAQYGNGSLQKHIFVHLYLMPTLTCSTILDIQYNIRPILSE